MSNIMPVLNQIIMLFLITAIGYLLRRKSVMTDGVIKGVNTVLLKVAWPCMILMTTQKGISGVETKGFLTVLAISVALMTVMCVLSFVIASKTRLKAQAQVFAVLSTMPNAGFVGMPIIEAVFGSEGVFYLSAFLVGFNLVAWTVCVFMFAGVKKESLKSMLNIGFITSIVGTLLLVFRIPLPTPLLSMSNQLGALTTPLAMLLLGARLDSIHLNLLKSFKLWLSIIIKLVAAPIITYIILKLMRIRPDLMGIIVLSMAMPSPSVAQLFAEKYDCDVPFAAAGVSFSTLLCIITIPLTLLLL